MQASKRPRKSSSPPKQYNDLQLALKFNEIIGNIQILADECRILLKDNLITNKEPILYKITERYKKLKDNLDLLNSTHTSQGVLPRDEYARSVRAIKAYVEKSTSLDFKIITSVSPSNKVNTPPRSSSR